ncbi:hypothetical protein RB195_012713 [Necator americanus]
MSDQVDSFYDSVNARNYGSLGNDDGITETMCNAFFDAHREADRLKISLEDAIALNQNKHHDGGPIEGDTRVNSIEDTHGNKIRQCPVVIHPAEEQTGIEVGGVAVQDENAPEITTAPKPAENLEDLTRLAMFGKQKTVLRRSQIKDSPAPAHSPTAASATPALCRPSPHVVAKGVTTSNPVVNRRSIKPQADNDERITSARSDGPRKPCNNVTASLHYRTAEAEKRPGASIRSPFIKANRTTTTTRPASHVPAGPVTRARSKELSSRVSNENTVQKNASSKTQANPSAIVENGVHQRLSTERISRNRAPRTTTSSRSSELARVTNPVRVTHEFPRNGNSFLRNERVPSARQFYHELLHRNSSLGSCDRSSSTPKDKQKQTDTSAAAGGTGSTTDKRPGVKSDRRPTPRASSLTRPVQEVVNRPANSLLRPRAASASRIPSIVRPPTTGGPTARLASITRPSTGRPPSVNRPQFPASGRPAAPRSTSIPNNLSGTVRSTTARRPVAIVGQSTAGVRVTPLHQKPTEPRSSVIRNPPSNKGPGDGTPQREFSSRLRRYPVPTGLTPLHRPLTKPADMKFHPMHGHGHARALNNEQTKGPLVTTEPSPAKVLSKQEMRAMIDRLSAPRGATKTPTKVMNKQTHGLSCVKIRSRSTSLARTTVQFGGSTTSKQLFRNGSEEIVAGQETLLKQQNLVQ